MMKNKIFLLIFIIYANNLLYAKNEDNFLQNIAISYENDSIYGEDKYYTNGLQLSFLSKNYYDTLSDNILFNNYSFGVGQKIFTSKDISMINPDKDDRPYAGYLYFYLNRNIFYKNNTVNLFGITVGTTGEASLAETAQKAIHNMIGSPEPKGWNTQLENEILLMLTWSNIKEIYKISDNFNIISKFTTNIGTPYTDLRQYLELRYGTNIFGDLSFNRIENNTIGILNHNKFDYYYFASFGVNYVFYNTFLNGNINSRREYVNIENFVYEFNIGFNIMFDGFYIKCLTTFLSKEFEAQDEKQTLFTITGGILF